ncbi:glycosyltransferase [Longitalea luteola]|uniref:glycosyltransferase n=1 Tax=Longitalea luteola TaxID=2812563 RepID=UPI001A96C57A|nr:glycosyltransferase [Longitalea luteola]
MSRAFVTFMTTDDYLPGVLALYKSLRFFNKKHDFVVLTTNTLSDTSKGMLEALGCKVQLAPEIKNPHIGENDRDTFNHYTKLRVYALAEYQKIIFLDADLIICSNLEPLFKAPHMSSVIAGGLIPENNWTDLNGGFMVVEPSLQLFNEMFEATRYLPSKDRTDQGFLQSFYKDWPENKALHLDHKFNVPANYLDIYCAQFGYDFSYTDQTLETNIAVIHYWGPVKPWHIDRHSLPPDGSPKFNQAIDLWWDFYTAVLIDIKTSQDKCCL